MEAQAKEISRIIYLRPVCVEVTTNDHQQMVKQARGFAAWADNIVVKIPVINESGEPSWS